MSKGDLIRVTVLTPPATTVVILEALGDGHSVSRKWEPKDRRLVVSVLNRKADHSRGDDRPDNLVRRAEFAETSVISVEELTRAELEKEKAGPRPKTVRKGRPSQTFVEEAPK
jgi:hypothetical protein